ncbi:hypothetical protein L195_g000646 [Trifolium pratense]|uniref:Cysteine-rich receptor-like protein kinase n=1 Tax=Trifolium pratense TaxID=57577 RepID=A0A2K3NMI5_TRIPR|nr:hypothetical protein L195_g000646 [Trifolium pratense]
MGIGLEVVITIPNVTPPSSMRIVRHSGNSQGSQDCDWAFLPLEGRSGGILSLRSKAREKGVNMEVCHFQQKWWSLGEFLEDLELVDLPLLGRFNNFWLENKRFKKEVEVAWGNLRAEGWMDYVLKEKLKGLKNSLKSWHKQECGGMESHSKGLVPEIEVLDSRGEESDLSSSKIQSRKGKFD